MKKYILLCLLFNFYAVNFGMHKTDLYAIEATMHGKNFYIKPGDFLYNSVWHNIITDIRNGRGVHTYSYSSVQAQSTEKNRELWEDEVDTYYKLRDNALSRINKRRDALKKEVDSITAFDTYLTGWSFGQVFFDILQNLRTFFRHKSHCNTIDAYNHVTAMKNRLEKLVGKRTTSARDIALLGYWSDGTSGCSESSPPYMSINIGDKSLSLHGEISNVLYDLR